MRVGIVSTSRADLGIYLPLIKRISSEPGLEPTVFLGGCHYNENIAHAKESLGDVKSILIEESFGEISCFKDLTIGLSQTVAAMTKAITSNAPKDLFLVLGDRFEMFACAISIASLKIPMLHIHGGELTYGAIDDKFRHSITQLSDFHFVSCEKYRSRVIQLGKTPESVMNIGSLSVCDIDDNELLSKEELSVLTGLNFSKDVALVTYHPETVNSDQVKSEIIGVLEAINKFDMQLLITGVNDDPGNITVKRELEIFAKNYKNTIFLAKTLGRKNYFSACKHSSLMIGNSSSGIIEAASFKLPVVNIGERQKGREQSNNIVNSSSIPQELEKAIDCALKLDRSSINNIYFQKNTLDKAVSFICKKIPELKLKPRVFFELNYE